MLLSTSRYTIMKKAFVAPPDVQSTFVHQRVHTMRLTRRQVEEMLMKAFAEAESTDLLNEGVTCEITWDAGDHGGATLKLTEDYTKLPQAAPNLLADIGAHD